jgi:hypothetical protein
MTLALVDLLGAKRPQGDERLLPPAPSLALDREEQPASRAGSESPGVDPAKLVGYSLRAGYATAAAAAGVEERKIANVVTRHKNLPVLRRYIRNATAFDDVGEVR